MKLTPKRILNKARSVLIRQSEGITNTLRTKHNRPLQAKQILLLPDNRAESSTIAIIVQGAILHTHTFTVETLRLYKKIFPLSTIILSTWNDEDSAVIEQLRREGIVVVLSEKPANPGVVHINFQLTSTVAGLERAKRLGALYALKTRTDQRIYNPRALTYFHTLQKAFPLIDISVQKERLIAIDMNTFKYRPYSISDMTMYGTVEDMYLYWNIPHTHNVNELKKGHSMVDWSRARHAESYLCTSFIQSLGREPQYTLADSWKLYRDHFCILNKDELDLFWYKYDKEREYRRKRYDGTYTDQELTFLEWLTLYASQDIVAPEELISQPFGATLQ